MHQTDFVLFGFRLIKSDVVTSLLPDDPAKVPELILEDEDGLSLALQTLFEFVDESKKVVGLDSEVISFSIIMFSSSSSLLLTLESDWDSESGFEVSSISFKASFHYNCPHFHLIPNPFE